MCIIRIRCKMCNEYTEFKVGENEYFKWMSTGNSDDLKLSIDDHILFVTKLCSKCRTLTRKEC